MGKILDARDGTERAGVVVYESYISVIVVSCRVISWYGLVWYDMVYRRVYIYVRIWMLMWICIYIYISAFSGVSPCFRSRDDDREVR